MGDQERKTKEERIRRLADRVHKAKEGNEDDPLIPVMLGILDLLADEL